MTLRISDDDHGRPVDLTTLAEDDRLLDQLGRGERPDGCDDVDALLSDWRARMPAPDPADDRLLAASVAAIRRPVTRWSRRSVVVATTALVAFGGLTAAAEHAGPDSPLWPITQLVYGDLADSRTSARDAGDTVADARIAIDSGAYDRASRLLDHAATLTDRVDEPGVADELRTRIATLRGLIPTVTDPLPATPPVPAVPGTPSATLPPTPTTNPPPSASDPVDVPDLPTTPPALLPPLPIDLPDLPGLLG